MAGIKSIDELRWLASDINSKEIIDHLDGVGKFIVRSEWLDSWHKAFDVACDEIEREIAERYMELPVDADGEVIRVGDTLSSDVYDNDFEVRGWLLGKSNDRWYVLTSLDNMIAVDTCRHVKPRTLEDVLRDCCNEWNEHCGNDWEQSIYAKYADEIRGLLGVEE